MDKKHIYLAGSLFSEAEVEQRLKEGKLIRSLLGKGFTVFNPIEAPINDKSLLPTHEDIFMGDTAQVLKSDVIIADLANNDPGVMMELGIAWGLDYAARALQCLLCQDEDKLEKLKVLGIKPKEVHAVQSDIRVATAGEYNGLDVPFGFNQYVYGGILNMNGKVHKRFLEAVHELEEDINE